MKKKLEKIRKITKAPDQKIEKSLWDEIYSQINKTSFKQSFDVLISHYKNVGENTHL